MAEDRLNSIISKLERAAVHIEGFEPPAPAEQLKPAPQPERAIEDRDRKIAKLRADIDDICKLKDEEIGQLRTELAGTVRPPDPEPGRELAALQRRYDALEAAASAALGRIDALIARHGEEHSDG